MPEYLTLTFNGTSINDADSNYMTIIPDLDAATENSIGILRGHHVAPSFGRPTPLERILTANIFIKGNNTGYNDLDTKLDTLKQLLDTNAGTRVLAVRRTNWSQTRYLNVHTRQFAVNRIERKVSVQFVAADPFWRNNTTTTQTDTITSNGGTLTLTNVGSKYALPKFSVKINTTNPNVWLYSRRIIIKNNLTVPIAKGYALDLTGGGWNTATLVSGSKMLSDGNDLRVEFDGVEIPRYLDSINTSTTKVWIVLPADLPALGALKEGGDLVTLGTNLAPRTQSTYATAQTFLDTNATGTILGNNFARNVIDTTWDTSGNPLNPVVSIAGSAWQVTGSTGTIILDLGSSKTVNRVRLLHLDSNSAAKNFTIQTSTDNSSYTTQITVTNNTVQGKYTVHDFDDVTARYIKVAITSMQGSVVNSQGTGLAEVEVYNAVYRLLVKYGKANAGTPGPWAVPSQPSVILPSTSTAWQPMFDTTNSTNARHVYTSFLDTTNEGKYRPAQWSKYNFFVNNRARNYGGTRDTLANPSNAMGVAQDTTNFVSGGFDSYGITEPCGLFAVNHSGNTKHNNTYHRWRQTSQRFGEQFQEVNFQHNVDTSAAWSFYSFQWFSWTAPTYNETKGYIYFTSVRSATDPSANIHYGEATSITLQLVTANTPTITWMSEMGAGGGTIISWKATIKNTTTNEALSFEIANFPTGTNLIIDCDTKTVYRSDNNQSILSSLFPDTVRSEWMTLAPGANTIAWYEANIVSVTVQTDFADRWN